LIGKTLGHYEISAALGKGGMGEVYRARDTKLGREVAIKVLPKEMSGDPERVARFEREARLLASLQHAHIASIYGFERDGGVQFLAMELVEGQTLEDRLQEGTLSSDETMRIASQMAAGLEAAHEKGVIHRDLKPANVMLTSEGDVKILDFGLARAWFGEADEEDIGASPTITAAMTQAGTILGTAAYMSPEQARGKNVDRRADIWAFGAILWEMVAGNRLFGGETISDTLAAVIRAEPEWELLPTEAQPQICHLIERCIVRDPRQRLRDIGEARILLQEAPEAPRAVAHHEVGPSSGPGWLRNARAPGTSPRRSCVSRSPQMTR
jgi:serine/threonine protein kinase